VLFVSFEESLSRLTLKVICAQAGLEAKKFSDGYFDQEELKQAVQLYSPNLSSLYFIEGTTQLTVSHLKARALQLMSKWKSRKCLVIVDYLQRWAASRKDFSEFRHIVSGLVSELRELAMRLDSPVIVISSQNRPGQGTSNLTSLKESGDLEYSADTAMFLVDSKRRRAVPPDRALDLVIEKNRYGDRGQIEFIFKPDIGIFKEQVK
jgi:replicative DNA helicase